MWQMLNPVSFARNRSRDIRAICQSDIYLPPIGGGGGHIESRWRRRLRARAGESGLNHNGRATRNANRVYHYDLADIGSPITLGVGSNRCSISAFDIYTNRPSQTIGPREF